jgi:hypothetical protein
LCGTIHELRIHGYFTRKVRDVEEQENIAIKIFAIYCMIAKEQKQQYTKRILPLFVIPECNIMLGSVMNYLSRNPREKINYAKAELILGAVDRRTMRKHIRNGRAIVGKTTLELMRVLAGQSGFARVPELKPGMEAWERLDVTVHEIDAAVTRMNGAAGEPIPAIGYVHVVYAFYRARKLLKTPLNRVIWVLVLHDTS